MTFAGTIDGKRFNITQYVEKTEDYFSAVYKKHSITIEREQDGSFYILVTDLETGMHAYNGVWGLESHKTVEEAVNEALKGAKLVESGVFVPKREDTRPLPCPFCGELPEMGPKDPKRWGNAWGYVRCVNDKCPSKPEVRDGELVADDRGTAAYIAIAIKRWNKRYI